MLSNLPSCCRREPEGWESIWLLPTPSSSTTRTGIRTMTSRYSRRDISHHSHIHPNCLFIRVFLLSGLQQSSSYRSKQEGDDLPIRHQGLSGGEDYSGKYKPSPTELKSWLVALIKFPSLLTCSALSRLPRRR